MNQVKINNIYLIFVDGIENRYPLMCVCIKVSGPKLYPLFPAVLTAWLVTLVQISRVLPLFLSPAAQHCRGPAVLHRDINPGHYTLHCATT